MLFDVRSPDDPATDGTFERGSPRALWDAWPLAVVPNLSGWSDGSHARYACARPALLGTASRRNSTVVGSSAARFGYSAAAVKPSAAVPRTRHVGARGQG